MSARFVDCRVDLADPAAGLARYREGHVPGAVHLSLNDDLSDLSATGAGRHPLPSADAFAAVAGRAGIGDGVTVVAYDDGSGMASARVWWLLRHFGHEDAGLLAGGLAGWRGPLRAGDEQPAARTFTPRARGGDTIGADELEERLGEPGLVVVDARAPERYRGDVEPLDAVAGHIPGALNWPFAQAGEIPGAVLAAEEIVVYCGSGVSACVNLHALALAGRADARLYPGSWSEWSGAGRAVATGG